MENNYTEISKKRLLSMRGIYIAGEIMKKNGLVVVNELKIKDDCIQMLIQEVTNEYTIAVNIYEYETKVYPTSFISTNDLNEILTTLYDATATLGEVSDMKGESQ